MHSSKSLGTKILLLLLLGCVLQLAKAAPGDVDLSFDSGSGINGTVTTAVLQPDGKLIISGEFTSVRGLTRTNLARLNADGTGDATFDPGSAYESVSAIALQTDGKVLVARGLLEYILCNGVYYSFWVSEVTRLNADGSADASFAAARGTYAADGDVPQTMSAIAVQTDGRVLVAGSGRNGIARLNSDGSLDSGFNPGSGIGGYDHPWIKSVILQADGKVIIGGGFTTFNEVYRNSLARLNSDGSLDLDFNPGAELWDYPDVRSLALQDDGKLIVGGDYFIARFGSNGTLDQGFPAGANGVVSSVAIQPDGRVLLGGDFTTVNGAIRNRIARLNANGSLDTLFNPAIGINAPIHAVIAQADGKVLVAGSFTTVDGAIRRRVARLDPNGGLDASFHPGTAIERPILDIALQPDGKVLIGHAWPGAGLFGYDTSAASYTFVNGTERYGSARLDPDGKPDETFISSTNFRPDLKAYFLPENCFDDPDPHYWCSQSASVTATLVQPDGKVLISGIVWAEIIGDEMWLGPMIIRIFLDRFHPDGSRDTSFEMMVGEVEGWNWLGALALQPDGKIVVGGSFASFKGASRSCIARLHADGSLDTQFDAGAAVTSGIKAIAVQDDGRVLIGGYLVDGSPLSSIARLQADGSLDATFHPGTGANGGVNAVALQPDGKVLIGGDFTEVGSRSRNRVARLQADGSLDGSFNPGTGADGTVHAMALQPDGRLLISGGFTTVNGVLRPSIARLEADFGGPPNLPPSVSITAPANNATYAAPATIDIDVVASDPDGTIARVDFYSGSTFLASAHTAPFELGLDSVMPGSYSLTADAVDDRGATTTSAAVNITVTNSPPEVSISNPVQGEAFASPAAISLTAGATDRDGTVMWVAFYAGNTHIATVYSAPFTFTWSNMPAGNYSLTARAADDLGASTTSAAVQISVTAPQPPAAPAGLVATAVSRERIDLTWADHSANEHGFRIEQAANGKAFKQIATVGVNVTSFSNMGLKKGTQYTYRVRAYNTAGNSAYSNPATARTLP